MNYRLDDETEYTKEELSKYLDDYHNNPPKYYNPEEPDTLFEQYVYAQIRKIYMTNKTVLLNTYSYTYYLKEKEITK